MEMPFPCNLIAATAVLALAVAGLAWLLTRIDGNDNA